MFQKHVRYCKKPENKQPFAYLVRLSNLYYMSPKLDLEISRNLSPNALKRFPPLFPPELYQLMLTFLFAVSRTEKTTFSPLVLGHHLWIWQSSTKPFRPFSHFHSSFFAQIYRQNLEQREIKGKGKDSNLDK